MTQAPWTNPVQTGTVSGTPVMADGGQGMGPVLSTVTLSADYQRAPPPGWPLATPAGQSVSGYAAQNGLIHSGTTLALVKPEADALILGGWAS